MAVRSSRATSGIGGSLILIIFIVLTITVFSVLTLVSAQNEADTVNRSAKTFGDYYTAEKAAAEKCGEIKKATEGLSANADIAAAAVSLGAVASSDEHGVNISFTTDIDDKRALETILRAEAGELKLVSQKTSSKNEGISIDDSIVLWDVF
ncbi:MAG: hypothetical protein NC394_02860 [Bacteroides sp.]|nr:hypothetical protein [Bacteroides sp.]